MVVSGWLYVKDNSLKSGFAIPCPFYVQIDKRNDFKRAIYFEGKN